MNVFSSGRSRMKTALLVALPILLAWKLMYMASWRPKTLPYVDEQSGFTTDAKGQVVESQQRNNNRIILSAAFSPDGNTVASQNNSDGTIKLWRTR